MSANDVQSPIATKVDRQQLLGDLVRLSAENRDYYGTVLKNDDRFQLRYYPSQTEGQIEETRLSWNEGVRALEQIAPRICTYLSAKGIQLPAAETKGAGLMAWVLRKWLVGIRGSAFSLTTAFDAIRESILMLDGNVLELATELYSKLHRLVQLHSTRNGRFYISYDNDNQDIGAFQATYGLHFEQLSQTLAAVDGSGNLGVRWHPELRMYLFDTIAYPKPTFSDGLPLAPVVADTFADEALERFSRLKGLYLRLWESINSNMPIERKANEDRRIWHEFGTDDDFSRLRQGMTWEASMIRRLVHERGGLGVIQNDTAPAPAVTEPVPVQPAVPIPSQTAATVEQVQYASNRRKPRSKLPSLVNKLRQKIEHGYTYESYVKLVDDIGGSTGTWTNVFSDTDNTDLVAWKDNRGVCTRNNQEAAKQEIHIDDEYLPDDEVEKLFQGYENRLPKKERQEAREAFDKLDPQKRRQMVQVLSD
jgi:hypothetical protein